MRLSKTKRGSPGFRFASLDRERINPVTRAFLKPRRTRLDRFFGEFPFEIATDRSPESDPRSKLSFRRRANPGLPFSSRIFPSRRPGGNLPDQQGEMTKTSNRRKTTGYKPKLARPSFSASRADRVFFTSFVYQPRSRPGLTHSRTNTTTTMAALSAVAPVLNKAPVVSTGKAANTNSMMVWQPHGNK
jgi:hypothetical protein